MRIKCNTYKIVDENIFLQSEQCIKSFKLLKFFLFLAHFKRDVEIYEK